MAAQLSPPAQLSSSFAPSHDVEASSSPGYYLAQTYFSGAGQLRRRKWKLHTPPAPALKFGKPCSRWTRLGKERLRTLGRPQGEPQKPRWLARHSPSPHLHPHQHQRRQSKKHQTTRSRQPPRLETETRKPILRLVSFAPILPPQVLHLYLSQTKTHVH